MLPISRSISTFHRSPAPKKRLPVDLFSLYLVANKPSYQDENLFFSKIKDSVKGGVSCVQLRDHKSDLATTINTAIRLKNMLNGTPLFINTLKSIEVVQAAEADGIYIEDKFPFSEARKLLGKKAIIGIPVKSVEEVLDIGDSDEIDYVSVKVYPSEKTSPINDHVGIDKLRNICAISPIPIVVIGGVKLANAESLYRELPVNVALAMAGGLMDEENPCLTAQKIHAIRQKINYENFRSLRV